jgi:hypothetical protein
LAPEEDSLRLIFKDLCISYEPISAVEEMLPHLRSKKNFAA